MADSSRILYCHCAYAKVVPPAVKLEVLQRLADAGAEFEAAPDLCEMSARRDPKLGELARGGTLKIAACFPRVVKALFGAAGAALPPDAEILNMRTASGEEVVRSILGNGRDS